MTRTMLAIGSMVIALLIPAALTTSSASAHSTCAFCVLNNQDEDDMGFGGDGATIGEGSNLVPGPFGGERGEGTFGISPTPGGCVGAECYGDDGSGETAVVGPWVIILHDVNDGGNWEPQPVFCWEDSPGDIVCG